MEPDRERRPGRQQRGGGIQEAPQDGNFYVRRDGQWLNLDALGALGITSQTDAIDGGNFSGTNAGPNETTYEGGDFTTGAGGVRTSLSTAVTSPRSPVVTSRPEPLAWTTPPTREATSQRPGWT